jgi:DNA polymerase elongation subunit (family B)
VDLSCKLYDQIQTDYKIPKYYNNQMTLTESYTKYNKRQDQCPFVQNTYNLLANMISNNASITECFNTLVTQVQYLIDGQISYNDLVHTKTVGTYQNENFFMNIFVNNLDNQGQHPQVGNKLTYLVIDKNSTLLGEKLILLEHYNAEPLDYDHYIGRLAPINKLFKDNFTEIPKDVWYRKNSHHKKIYLDEPIKFIKEYYESTKTLPN